ncbi:MAG: DUF2783 domain-containing protein [Gammaproteobacteria bacterium]|nr:DUF2783 domain-containing protein [Gammaproteobacteria bacterium]
MGRMSLHTDLRIDDPDGFYEKLIDLHEGLTPAQSHMVNAKLIMLLANQVADRELLDRILELVRPAGPA